METFRRLDETLLMFTTLKQIGEFNKFTKKSSNVTKLRPKRKIRSKKSYSKTSKLVPL